MPPSVTAGESDSAAALDSSGRDSVDTTNFKSLTIVLGRLRSVPACWAVASLGAATRHRSNAMGRATLADMATGAAVISLALQLLAPSAATHATIRGQVFNADGKPQPDVELRVLAVASERDYPGARSAMSNADGKFEITGVPAGKILLRAQPRMSAELTATRRLRVHPPAYFPGVLDLKEAWPIDVKPGEIIELDFHIPAVFIGSIRTVVTGPDGYSLDQLRVIRPEANQIKNVTLDEGVGHVDGLREGRYIVVARGRSRDALLAASQIVQITGGEVPVTLNLAPAARVSGRLIAERGAMPPIDNVRVVATWTDGNIALDPLARDESYVSADGSFRIDGLFGMRTFQVAGLPGDWNVSAVRQGSSDITSSGVDLAAGSAIELSVVLTQQARAMRLPEPPPLNPGTSSIHGRVIDALSGKPIEGAEVRLSRHDDRAGETKHSRAHGDDAVIHAIGQDPDPQRRQLHVRRHQGRRVPAPGDAPDVPALMHGSGGSARAMRRDHGRHRSTPCRCQHVC